MSKYPTAYSVLENVRQLKEQGHSFNIVAVYEKLSIFDWFKNTLSVKDLSDMERFLERAILLGFDGYVCFKVGASGCANGMWAHNAESETGYSPNDCDVLFRSFTPSYTEWAAQIKGQWLSSNDADGHNDTFFTSFNALEKAIVNAKLTISKRGNE